MAKRANKLFLNKKAVSNEVYHILIQIIIAIAFYWILQSYVDSIAKDTLFEKTYIANDMALLMNTIYSGPGQTIYIYENPDTKLKDYTFSFAGKQVSVVETGKAIPFIVPYGQDNALPYNGIDITSSDSIVFSKTKTNLLIEPK